MNTTIIATYSPDKKAIAVGNSTGSVFVWDLQSEVRKLPQPPLLAGEAFVTDLKYSPDGKTLASAIRNGIVTIWDCETWKCLSVLRHKSDIICINFSMDGKNIVSACKDCYAYIWDCASGKLICTLHGHTNWVVYADYLNEERIITHSFDNTVCIWNTQGRCLSDNFCDGSRSALSEDRKRIALVQKNVIGIWNLSPFTLVKQFPKPPGRSIFSLMFRGKNIVVLEYQNVYIYNWETGDCVYIADCPKSSGMLSATEMFHTENQTFRIEEIPFFSFEPVLTGLLGKANQTPLSDPRIWGKIRAYV